VIAKNVAMCADECPMGTIKLSKWAVEKIGGDPTDVSMVNWRWVTCDGSENIPISAAPKSPLLGGINPGISLVSPNAGLGMNQNTLNANRAAEMEPLDNQVAEPKESRSGKTMAAEKDEPLAPMSAEKDSSLDAQVKAPDDENEPIRMAAILPGNDGNIDESEPLAPLSAEK
jgi:hypothetical protein